MSSFPEIFLLTLAGLIPIVNPLSTAPLFVALTDHFTPSEQMRVARKAPLYAFVILAFFLIAGDTVIDFFGVSIAGVRVAGGIVIGIVGLQMMFPQFSAPQTAPHPAQISITSVALSPLAIPSISGPGSIAVVLSIGAAIPDQNLVLGYLAVLLAMALVMLIVYVTFLSASYVARRLGQSLIDGITRIMGFLLIALAVQFVAIGITKFQSEPPKPAAAHQSP